MSKYRDVSSDVVRLAGLMAVGLGIAWALQSLGFGLTWVLGAAVISGAGTGLVCATGREAHAPIPVRFTSNPQG